MDSIIDNFALIDVELGEDLELIEQQVVEGARSFDATDIYRLKREVLEVRRAVTHSHCRCADCGPSRSRSLTRGPARSSVTSPPCCESSTTSSPTTGC